MELDGGSIFFYFALFFVNVYCSDNLSKISSLLFKTISTRKVMVKFCEQFKGDTKILPVYFI